MENSTSLFFTENPNRFQSSSSWNFSTGTELVPALVPRKDQTSDHGFKWNSDQMVRDQKGFKKVISSSGMIRPALQATEHMIAERKRREKISQHFIALAAVIPGLKKTDKASILGDAINYVKKLEGSVKSLQEYQKMKTTIESVVIIQKDIGSPEEDGSSSTNHSSSNKNDDQENPNQLLLLPGIEVRLSEKTILVKIHCKNQKGVLVRILSEIEKHHLMVTYTSAMNFSDHSFVDITITALIEEGFSMTVKDLVKKIYSAAAR